MLSAVKKIFGSVITNRKTLKLDVPLKFLAKIGPVSELLDQVLAPAVIHLIADIVPNFPNSDLVKSVSGRAVRLYVGEFTHKYLGDLKTVMVELSEQLAAAQKEQ